MAGSEKFLFITSNNASDFKTAAAQTVIRQHASRKGSRARQANFKFKRQDSLQLPPDKAQAVLLSDQISPGDTNIIQQHDDVEPSPRKKAQINKNIEGVSHQKSVPIPTSRLIVESQFASVPTIGPSVCRLGRGGFYQAQICPVELDSPTQSILERLLDDSPYNRFRGYRNAWLPMVLSDPAGFQQFLSTFALHLQRLEPSMSAELNIPTLMLHSKSLESVNFRIQSPDVGRDSGLLVAVISFVAHYQVQERYDMWQVHMHGLKKIIILLGGMKRAFANKPELRMMVFFIDLQGSWLQDKPAIFPPPYDLLPRLSNLPVNLSTLSSFYNATKVSETWRTAFTQQVLVPSILDDLIIVTAHLTEESIRTEAACWTDTVAIGLLVNPLVYRLYGIHVREPCCSSRGLVLQEAFRIAALLFLNKIKWHTVFISSLVDLQVFKLKRWLNNANNEDWTGFEVLKAWILVMGAIFSRRYSAERLWFQTEILRGFRCMKSVTLTDYLAQVKNVLWVEDLFGQSSLTLWKELRMLLY